MLQSMRESVPMPAHWGSAGFFILTYSKPLYFRVSILTGRRAAWVPDSDPGGWQESLISQHFRTYYSLERQKAQLFIPDRWRDWSLAVQVHRWPIIKSGPHRCSCPADSGKTLGKHALAWGYFPWPKWWCGLWNCFCYSHRNLFHRLTGTCLVRANKLKPMAPYSSDSSHRAFICISESL